MRNVKCKAQPTKGFFDTVIKWNRWTQFRHHSRKLGGTAKHLIDGSQKCFGRWALNFRDRMLLKGAEGSVHTRGNVAGTCCNEVSSCAIPVYAKNIFVFATQCKEFSWFDFVRHETRTLWHQFTMSHHCSYKLSPLHHRNESISASCAPCTVPATWRALCGVHTKGLVQLHVPTSVYRPLKDFLFSSFVCWNSSKNLRVLTTQLRIIRWTRLVTCSCIPTLLQFLFQAISPVPLPWNIIEKTF